jgi:hypothetical protein
LGIAGSVSFCEHQGMLICKAQRMSSVFSLLAMTPLLTLPLVPSTSQAAGDNRALAFQTAAEGGFTFDTGVVRGKLRPQGKGIGLTSVVHIPSGLMLDRGDKGYGLFSHYRVFSVGKRYGVGAWDWPGTARLRDDGAVEVVWLPESKRPFEMRAVYRWSSPATLDLETQVRAEQALPGFESFLASYFDGRFINELVYAHGTPSQPAFLAASKERGDWQMFPRDQAAVDLIRDGRWQLQPNPVQWVILPALTQPIAVRRDPVSGVTAGLLSVKEDCFAIATPFQTEGHFSTYLSLFGRDLKAGETARARARLVIADSFSEQKLLESQKTLSSLRAD